jgi:hypothetical protein
MVVDVIDGTLSSQPLYTQSLPLLDKSLKDILELWRPVALAHREGRGYAVGGPG